MAAKPPKLVGQEAFVLVEEIPPFIAEDYRLHHKTVVAQRRRRLDPKSLEKYNGYKKVTGLEFLPESNLELRIAATGLLLHINKARRRPLEDPNPDLSPVRRRQRSEWARIKAGQKAVDFLDQSISHRRQLFDAVDPETGVYDIAATKTELAASGLARYRLKIEFFNDRNYPHAHWRKRRQPYRQAAAAFVDSLTDRQRLDFFYEALWDTERRQIFWTLNDPRPKNKPAEPSWDSDYLGDYEEWLQPESMV